MKNKKISININFKQFENPIYLYKKALYLQSEIPHSFENIMKFYLANLFICKQVLESIIRYMRELRRYIENTHNDYLTSRSNRLIKSWYQFIGCCDNTVNIILDYEAFYEQIQIKLGTMTKATRLNFPPRYGIRISI